jgi:TPR repeat protein
VIRIAKVPDYRRSSICFPEDLSEARDCYARNDVSGALKLISAACEAGSPSAECVLAQLYLTASANLGRDKKRALELAYPHAVNGNALAQVVIAWIYVEDGRPLEAIGFMRRAASQQFPPALLDMGRFYFNGIGVPRDRAEGLNWYRRAHASGHVIAWRLMVREDATGRRGRWRKWAARTALPLVLLRLLWRWYATGYWGPKEFFYDPNVARRANVPAQP